jgi:hypothetical protein
MTAIDKMKNFNWQEIINRGTGLDDFNDAQWKFVKGFIVEMISEKYCNNELVAVREDHKDFDWPNLGLTLELKSQLSGPMYNKNGTVKKNYEIVFNNSQGTNKLDELPDEHVTDYLLVIRNDGAFVIDRDTTKKYAIKKGDGFKVVVPGSEIIELSGKITAVPKKNNLRQLIEQVIRDNV